MRSLTWLVVCICIVIIIVAIIENFDTLLVVIIFYSFIALPLSYILKGGRR